MSDKGAEAALEHVTVTADVVCKPRPGYLTQYLARHKGAFERFIEANDIILLENPEWGQKKEALAASIL